MWTSLAHFQGTIRCFGASTEFSKQLFSIWDRTVKLTKNKTLSKIRNPFFSSSSVEHREKFVPNGSMNQWLRVNRILLLLSFFLCFDRHDVCFDSPPKRETANNLLQNEFQKIGRVNGSGKFLVFKAWNRADAPTALISTGKGDTLLGER